MIVINSNINQVLDFDDFEIDVLRKDLEALGIDDFINVGEVPHLLNALEVNKYQQIILFTNFSPKFHFKKRGIDVSKFRIPPLQIPWCNEQYRFSAELINYCCQKYPIVEVHFITSALIRIVNDVDFGSITNGAHTTIQRKRDWFYTNSDIPYNVYLKKYILDCLHRFIKSDSILIPNQPKTLLRGLGVNLCQN